MVFKNFRLQVTTRLILIVLLAGTTAFVLLQGQMIFAPVVLMLAIGFLTYNLIRYIERTHRDLTHFLLSVRQGSFTEVIKAGDSRLKEVSKAMNDVIQEFAKLNEQKELHHQFLEALNENLGVAIMSFDKNGKLTMQNQAAKRLFRRPAFKGISDFASISPALHETVQKLKPEQRIVLRALIHDQWEHLSIQMKEIMLKAEPVKILLFQNLNHELEEKEIDAWHQLMRVLTHEIMNSVTPILSLTSAVQKILRDETGGQRIQNLSPENIDDVYDSLETIGARSKGLMKFVNAYREYARNIEVHADPVNVYTLTERIVGLLRPDLRLAKIDLTFSADNPDIVATLDATLIEQVIINLIRNAMEAVAHDGSGKIQVRISARTGGGVVLTITDNGRGIDEDTLSKIFIPFFTTKAKGSGIGLSLCRQIVHLHHGSIHITSEVGVGTVAKVEL